MSHTQPPVKPRRLPRSPSDPIHLSQAAQGQKPIYVLTADGSSLILLDPSKPTGGEEPPPYASFTIADTTSAEVGTATAPLPSSSRSSPRGVAFPVVPSVSVEQPVLADDERSANCHSRLRASTLSALSPDRPVPRPRLRSSLSNRERRAGSVARTPERRSVTLAPDERTPLLSPPRAEEEIAPPRRGWWRSIFCGDLDTEEEIEGGTWGAGWKRFWRPVGRAEYWRAILHLVLFNFPFALFIWPPLVAGTLAGTALLITLPIGAAVWWLTLFLSRSAARLETIMQLRYHPPMSTESPQPRPTYHPIFYRVRERSLPSSPHVQAPELFSPGTDEEGSGMTTIWEKKFIKCSYAMFLDHYSYSALSYFLLIKPLITLFSTIVLVALLPVALASILGWPVYLRAMRRWGRWQAKVALDNL